MRIDLNDVARAKLTEHGKELVKQNDIFSNNAIVEIGGGTLICDIGIEPWDEDGLLVGTLADILNRFNGSDFMNGKKKPIEWIDISPLIHKEESE